jgi:hypothetical protein
MRTVQCPKGHNYDSDANTFCPHCGVQGLGVTVPQTQAVSPTRPGHGPTEDARPGSTKLPYGRGGSPDVTVPLQILANKMDPVVGWLVCILGPSKGRDYRLHSDWNKVGRDPRMDVCIQGDETISRDNQCEIGFDPKDHSFTLARGDGRAMVYLNGKRLSDARILQAYDRIEIGQSSFLFVPFCTEVFNWQNPADGADAPGT